jgi:hypothetical protein
MVEHHHHHAGGIHTGQVVLDIGDDMGGLIVYTDADLHGQEIEVFPRTRPELLTHTDVHQRVLGGQTIFTAVFTPLPIGEYEVARPPERAGQSIAIVSGTVTEIDWRRVS